MKFVVPLEFDSSMSVPKSATMEKVGNSFVIKAEGRTITISVEDFRAIAKALGI